MYGLLRVGWINFPLAKCEYLHVIFEYLEREIKICSVYTVFQPKALYTHFKRCNMVDITNLLSELYSENGRQELFEKLEEKGINANKDSIEMHINTFEEGDCLFDEESFIEATEIENKAQDLFGKMILKGDIALTLSTTGELIKKGKLDEYEKELRSNTLRVLHSTGLINITNIDGIWDEEFSKQLFSEAMKITPFPAYRAQIAEKAGLIDEAIEIYERNENFLRAYRLARRSSPEKAEELFSLAVEEESRLAKGKFSCLCPLFFKDEPEVIEKFIYAMREKSIVTAISIAKNYDMDAIVEDLYAEIRYWPETGAFLDYSYLSVAEVARYIGKEEDAQIFHDRHIDLMISRFSEETPNPTGKLEQLYNILVDFYEKYKGNGDADYEFYSRCFADSAKLFKYDDNDEYKIKADELISYCLEFCEEALDFRTAIAYTHDQKRCSLYSNLVTVIENNRIEI